MTTVRPERNYTVKTPKADEPDGSTAVIGTKALKKQGRISDLDESEEINACSINMIVDHDGVDEEWLLMFKNETHNHPTEIEPLGRGHLFGRRYPGSAVRA